MQATVKSYLENLKLGEIQVHENMAVFPLFAAGNGGPSYLTLKEALDKKLITVTEIAEAGSVPELKVANSADLFVLLLDGEELAGAKQNRVLNTSILMRGKSEAVIPVSCTEAGRWAYTSAGFHESGNIMARSIRSSKTRSVSESLRTAKSYRSDQGQVWNEISRLHEQAGSASPTGAMQDAYQQRAKDLDQYFQAFACQPKQQGLLVFVNGEVAGMDVLSQAPTYELIHPKLVKSYAMDALVQKAAAPAVPAPEKARAFVAEAAACEGSTFASTGAGTDHRFQSTRVVGSALEVDGHVIHLAFFRTEGGTETGRISSYTLRRQFRQTRGSDTPQE